MSEPHQDQPVEKSGAPLDSAAVAVILIHGRDRSPSKIIQSTESLPRDQVAYLAPAASDYSWYPNSFLAPIESNEPGRSSAIRAIKNLVTEANDAGISTDQVVVFGFSQGACIASEFVVENPTRYGGLVSLSGGLMDESIGSEEYDSDLEGTPVFVGCSNSDSYMPEEQIHESAAVFERLHSDVTKRLYEDMGHTISEDELDVVSEMIDNLL